MKTNVKRKTETLRTHPLKTHEGAPAYPHLSTLDQLRRSVLACFLWENEFYEDGVTIAERIKHLAEGCEAEDLARLAIEARHDMKLRHAPLLLLCVLARQGKGSALVADTIERAMARADDMTEFAALYAMMNGVDLTKRQVRKIPFSAQMKKGLAAACRKFDRYQLAKYDRAGVVRLRRLLQVCHPFALTPRQEEDWKLLLENRLPAPDTWESNLVAGKDKKATFERLLTDDKLGYMALLRNLRNMEEAGVDPELIESRIKNRRGARSVLPFRFITAAQAAPRFEGALNRAMIDSIGAPTLKGKMVIVVDVSGSMDGPVAGRSIVTRMVAASALAAIARSMGENVRVFATAGNDGTRVHATAEVPAREGMALIDAIKDAKSRLGHGGIFLNPCLRTVREKVKEADRLIVLTDEQDCAVDRKDSPFLADPFGRFNYLINVASYRNGVGYGKWTHIDGFSEATLRYIVALEEAQELRRQS